MTTTKLYQTDVYLRQWEAHITAINPSADGYFEIQLDRTAFFPQGGGQGADHGTLYSASCDLSFAVVDVQEIDGNIIHTVQLAAPTVRAADDDAQPNPFGLDTSDVIKAGCGVRCTLDWDRRFEHMQRHCAEHILSGVLYNMFGGSNHGFHMGHDYMTIDISLPDKSNITPQMARQAELAANRIIWDDLPVHVTYFDTRQEADKMPLRKPLAFDEAISIVTIGSPADTTPADCVACCGTHPSTTGQVGLIKIYKTEKYKDMTRIYCDGGKKALCDYDRKHDILTELSNRYSASIEEFPGKLHAQEEKNNAVRNELHELKKICIAKESAKLDTVLQEIASTSDTPVISYPLEHFTMDDAFNMAKPYMGKLSAGEKHPLLLLEVIKSNSCVLVSDGTADCGKLVKEYAPFYNGKGGGNSVSARVMFSKSEDVHLFVDLLEKYLR